MSASEAEGRPFESGRARQISPPFIVRAPRAQPPVLVYDPAYANMFYPRYRYPYRSFYYPYAYAPFPYDGYRWVGGGEVQTLKAVAIRFTDERTPAVPAGREQ